MMDVSLVIACYNEEPVLEESMSQIFEILDSTPWEYEIIFVDDCSKDRTRKIIQEICEANPERNLSYLFHEVNLGRGGTVSDGIQRARSNVVGFIDIDLEVHARYIPSMVLAINRGADISSAMRVYQVKPRLFHRYVLSKGYIWLVHTALGLRLFDTETGFKFFRKDKILPVLDLTEDQHWFWDTEVMALASEMSYRIEEIPCLFIKRYDKKSSVKIVQDTKDYLVKLWKFRKRLQNMRSLKAQEAPVLN